MKVIIACAGTGGHINPGVSIANYIKEQDKDSDILFIGAKIGLENTLIPKAGYKLKTIRSGRFHRKITMQNVINMRNAYLGIKDSEKIMKEFKPDIVIGTGGFICVPVMRAAYKLGIPYVLHESNAFPGLSVKLTAKNAAKIFVGFDEARERINNKNIVFTGTPTKFNVDNIFNLDKKQCLKDLHLDKKAGNKKIIFVTGGSQGAQKFNEVVINMIKKYRSDKFFVIISTGVKNYDSLKESIKDDNLDDFLELKDYVYEMDKTYKCSDLLITRAGALTVTEIAIVRRASILIPLPYAAENHQMYNAKALEKVGAGRVIDESVLNEDVLYDTIMEIIASDDNIKQMGENASVLYIPDVLPKIYNEIIEVIRGK